jgi:hypothetical protein
MLPTARRPAMLIPVGPLPPDPRLPRETGRKLRKLQVCPSKTVSLWGCSRRVREQFGNIKSSVAFLGRFLCSSSCSLVLEISNQGALSRQQPESREVRNCVSGFSRELAVPPSKLVLLFNAAFCRREESLSYWRGTRFLERAMGIEPTSEAWEALNKTLKSIELAALSFLRDGLNWKPDGN